MNLVRWQFENIDVPMMEDEDGMLYCTSPVIASALGIDEITLRTMYHYHHDEFEPVRLESMNAYDFLKQHKQEFSIKRLRKDMHLWTEDDMITFAVFSKSDRAREFRRGLKQFIKQQARRQYISKEEYDTLAEHYANLYQQFQLLTKRVGDIEQAQPHLQATASAAGAALSHQRYTKRLRQTN